MLEPVQGTDQDDYFAGYPHDATVVEGGLGDDYLYGGSGNNVLNGGGGANYLEAGAGDDTLAGGHGDDRLHGGEGDDVYVWNRGDGYDRIFDDQGANVLKLGEKIRPCREIGRASCRERV